MTHPELLRLRDSIDNIDAALIHLLAERFKCTQAVGEFKATHNFPPPIRRARQPRSRGCANWPRTPSWIRTSRRKFLNFIVKEVIRHHEAMRRADLMQAPHVQSLNFATA
jgi:chorismate mutase